MNFSRCFRIALAGCVITAASTLAAGCSSGGSGTAEGFDDSADSVSIRTGAVNVFITDGPIDDFAALYATISQIDLVSEGGHATLYSGYTTLDLLKLENYSELFSVTSDVPTGEYSKLRLSLVKLEPVLHSGEWLDLTLPADGKLDLVPGGTFNVVPGETLAVEIDIDANKSIHVVETGHGGYIFRPVAFVRVASEAPSKLVRALGYVNGRPDVANNVFEMCRVVVDDQGSPQIFLDTCSKTALADGGSVFQPDGEPGAFSDLRSEQFVTVIGTYNELNGGMLEAAVIEMAGWVLPSKFVTVTGTVGAEPLLGAFDFSPYAGESVTDDSMINVQLQSGTKVFSATGDPLDTTAIDSGVEAEVDGVLSISSVGPDTLWSALVVLDTTAPLQELSGQITAVAGAEKDTTITLATSDGVNACFRLTADALVQLITESAASVISEPGSISDLQVGRDVDGYGSLAVDGCFDTQIAVVFTTGSQQPSGYPL